MSVAQTYEGTLAWTIWSLGNWCLNLDLLPMPTEMKFERVLLVVDKDFF